MLEISLPEREFFDENINKFIKLPAVTLRLEHSLLSIKKWESRWHKPFLHTKDKSEEMLRDYIYCMSTVKVEHIYFDTLPPDSLNKIVNYINDPMTATTVKEEKKEGASNNPKEILTAELIYYYMIKANIPIEFQKWHFNQLMILLRVFGAKDGEENKKMSKQEAMAHRNALNMKRRAKMHSKG